MSRYNAPVMSGEIKSSTHHTCLFWPGWWCRLVLVLSHPALCLAFLVCLSSFSFAFSCYAFSFPSLYICIFSPSFLVPKHFCFPSLFLGLSLFSFLFLCVFSFSFPGKSASSSFLVPQPFLVFLPCSVEFLFSFLGSLPLCIFLPLFLAFLLKPFLVLIVSNFVCHSVFCITASVPTVYIATPQLYCSPLLCPLFILSFCICSVVVHRNLPFFVHLLICWLFLVDLPIAFWFVGFEFKLL